MDKSLLELQQEYRARGIDVKLPFKEVLKDAFYQIFFIRFFMRIKRRKHD